MHDASLATLAYHTPETRADDQYFRISTQFMAGAMPAPAIRYAGDVMCDFFSHLPHDRVRLR